jgi:cephalosporin hydroxylase
MTPALRSTASARPNEAKIRVGPAPTKRPRHRVQTLAKLVLGGFSVVPLLMRLSKLNDTATPDAVVDFSLGYPAIRPLQIRSEFLEFARMVAEVKPKVVLEIGTYRGGTLFVLSRLSAPDATIISVDLPTTTLGPLIRSIQEPIFKRFTRPGQKLHLLRENSHEAKTVARISEILAGKKLDLLFVDGDHSYAGVKSDFEMYSPFVRNGGLVVFHDAAGNPWRETLGASNFWDEVKGSYQSMEIIHERGPHSMGIGVLWIK